MKQINFTRIFRILGVVILLFMAFDRAFTPSASAGNAPYANLPANFTQPAQSNSANENASMQNRGVPITIHENKRSVQIELITPDFNIEQSQADGQSCQILTMENAAESQQPGLPRLPIYGTMVGVPSDSQPTLTILQADQETVEGQFTICPAPQPIFEISANGDTEFQTEAAKWDQEGYAQNHFSPAEAATLTDPAMIRSQSVVQLQFNPFQYNPVTGELKRFTRILVQIDYGKTHLIESILKNPRKEGVFESILEKELVNYHAAAEFRSNPAPTEMLEASAGGETPQAKILVNQAGMVEVKYEDLANAGLVPNEIIPATIQVFNQGNELAIEVIGGDDGAFNPGDKVVFFGQPLDTRYTDTNIYWMTWNVTNGRRMSTVNVQNGSGQASSRYLFSEHIEKNSIYQSSVVDTRGDHWFWAYLGAISGPVSESYTFDLANIDQSAAANARLRGSFKSNYASPRHHTKIFINDQFVTESFWNTGTQYDFDISIPMSFLVEGRNTIRVDIPLDGGITVDTLYVNWFKIDYWKTYTASQDYLTFNGEPSGTYKYTVGGFTTPEINLYDVTNPLSVEKLTGYTVQNVGGQYQTAFKLTVSSPHNYVGLTKDRYLAAKQVIKETSSSLKSTSNGADYLLITPMEFASEMQPLADWRANQGMRVMMVDVQDIYDEFNYGVMDPVAIRDFLAYAYHNWQSPAPQFVLLAGDGHYDPRNYKGTNEKVFIPAYLLPIDPYLLETASDNRYVTVSGSDNLPDMIIGRLPIKTAAEASNLVTKIIDYEQVPYDVDWNDRVLFVADNPDSAGNFYNLSDAVVNGYLPVGYTPSKVYYGSTHTSVGAAQSAIMDQINQGALLVNYVGHSTYQSWASENLLHASSAGSFNNTGRLPMFAMMACLTGSFHFPSPAGVNNSSIAESVLMASNKGAIASLGSTGMGVSTGQDYLNRGLYQAIFFEGKTQIGMASYLAKLYLYSHTPSFRDLLDTFTLFGDPATRLNVRPSDLTVQLEADPAGGVSDGMPVTYTLTYRNIGLAQASHVRIDHPLPEALLNTVIETSDASLVQISGSRISWEIDALAPGDFGTITVTGNVNASGRSSISTQATIDSPIPDSDLTNNTTQPLQIPVMGPTAVFIESSSALFKNGVINLSWVTNNEVGLRGFNLYRSDRKDVAGVQINTSQIMGQTSGSILGAAYTYEDENIEFGRTYYYSLEILQEGASIWYDFQSVSSMIYMYLPFMIQ